MKIFRKMAFTSLLVMSALCKAQSGAEEIVVTGIRASDSGEMPSVTFKKKADFLVQSVQLINDSRSPDLRKSEIIQTIKNLLSASKKIKGIEISYGEGFLVPLTLDSDSLKILDDKRTSDTSRISIFIKIAVSEKELAKDKIEELKKFLKGADLVGRTLLEEKGDIGLTIINPEQYRYEVLSLIAKENNKLKASFGPDCTTEIDGVSNRVEWERTSIDELVLFIRFNSKIMCK